MNDLQQTILITGATSGFGKETAKIFIKNGWNVIITGRKSPNSLYDEDLVTFEEGSFNYNHNDAEGFIKLNALRLMMNKIKQK